LAGISFVCVGVAGMAFLLSRQNNPTTDECEIKNMEDDLEETKYNTYYVGIYII